MNKILDSGADERAALVAALETALEISRKGVFFGGDAVDALTKSADIISAALAKAQCKLT